ncbi:CGNR zinc finger domain-containing protein [Curtobacterium pusillum]|uniref:CGNR zinc finger domain-containing protein n=2 Tax=Curtobacterium pusillum TaxID=69373 RepID=A0ABX2M9S0_9MICO|nr:CGNR zinc finger domain-containing protein [Curtobacterium pusillum]GLK31760.1 hypothetical protein GCM10017610_20450 [Curtobacterium pusillum]
MPFNHDNMIGVRLAERLVNLRATRSWTSEALASALHDALVRFDTVDPELERGLSAWASELRTVFAADDVDGRMASVNAVLAVGVRKVQLATHDGLPPHLHFADHESGVLDRVRAMTSGGLAVFATEAGGGRMGICARQGCDCVFADVSKNGRRAYCSAACGNRDAVQRYRARSAHRR